MKVVGPSALVLITVLGASAWHAARADDTTRNFEIYGFAMADWIQDTKRVDPSWQDAFRPSRIAAPEGEFGTNGQSSLSVKQSRFGVKGTLPTSDHSPPVNFKFEFDMFGVGADAGKTTIRLRHAYGEWGQLLAGQTHSLFMDIDVFPNVIDYWGPPGMVFFRNVQVRWTAYRTANDSIAVAIERPGNDVDAGTIRTVQGFENASVRADQTLPDFTGQYRHDDTWGHYQLGVIFRKVGFEYSLAPCPNPPVPGCEPYQKGHQTGWGLDLSGHINTFDKDKLLLSLVHGSGIASYMNDGGMDIAPTTLPTGTPPALGIGSEAVPLTGIMVYYDHYWNNMYSTSLGYSYTSVANTDLQNPTAFHKGEYASINLLSYPAPKVMVGIELMWGKLHNNDGTTGDDVRFQFSAKYDFGTKL
jgi:DcaP outer membrane protein